MITNIINTISIYFLCGMSEVYKSSLSQQTTMENMYVLMFASLCVLLGI